MKKRSKFLAIALAAVTMTSVIGGCGKTETAKEKKLVISTWGLSEDALWTDVLKPFEQQHNVKIVLDKGNNSERLTKLKNNPNSEIDLMYLAESFSAQGIEQQLFDKVDYSKISNSSKVNSKAKGDMEKGYGPAYTLNRIAIAYNPKKIGFEIKSWKDLWRPELKGKIAIPDITTTFGPAVVQIAAQKAGVDIAKDKGEAAFKELEALKPNVVKTYSKSSDLVNMFSSGEIVAAIAADFVYGSINASVPDVVFADPVEGAYLNFNTINITKNSKNKELALEFINYALSAEVQAKTAKSIKESPVNVDVKLSQDESKNLTYGDVINKANVLDYKVINPLMKEWIDKWNRILNK